MRSAHTAPQPIVRGLVVALAISLLSIPAARGDDPRESWLEGRTYEKKEIFRVGAKSVEAYSAKLDETEPDRETSIHRFLVVDGDTVALAYSADVRAIEGEKVRVELARHSNDVESPRVSIEIATAPTKDAYSTARRLVEDALAVDELWTTVSGTLERAIAEQDSSARRPFALAATRVLDRACAAHPDHVGLLHDLLTSYQLLLPLEAGSDRAANISFLWRDRLRTYVRLRDGDEEAIDVFGRTLSACGLAEGCYALAWLGAEFATKHGNPTGEETVTLLGALGQDHHVVAADDKVDTTAGPLRVATFKCTDEPTDGGAPFHRISWLTFGGGSGEVPTPVWYSLTCERTGERVRWALYGNVGGSRRLLRLFGPNEPSAEDATRAVEADIRIGITLAGKK